MRTRIAPRLAMLAVLSMSIVMGCSKGGGNGDPRADDSVEQAASAGGSDEVTVAFVTNQIASFWNIAKVGCEDAGKDLDIGVDVRMPPNGDAAEQKQIVEDLLSGGIKGIAISPIDAENQVDLLNKCAAKIPLITQDSDAPDSDRLMYIGMDNYVAGRMCGEMVKQALPEGGEILLTIGRLEQDNSRRRRQGVIDVLMGREEMGEYDPTGDVIEGNGYKILDTLTDQGKVDVAKRKAEDAITTYPELDAFVGLFAYNPPACLQALKSQSKLGKIKLIGFDEDAETLQGIKDGHVVGTVVQDPYNYGYKSIEILKSLVVDNDHSVIPESKFIDIPARAITKENVDEFWDQLKALTGG